MDEKIARIIGNIGSFEQLRQFEKNVAAKGALNPDLMVAIRARAARLGRKLVAEKTGLPLENLTPAEMRIVQVVSEYVGVMKHRGKTANRTFMQLRNRGLKGAVEVAVTKSTPTQGFQTLVEVALAELSYEQIVVDHPTEFSTKALRYSRRTLGLTHEPDLPVETKTKSNDSRTSSGAEMRNPIWSRDELVLALDLHFRTGGGSLTKTDPALTELSDLLITRGRALGVQAAATYRNANGVYMKMMNFRRFDPAFGGDGLSGLSQGSQAEEEVWLEFAGFPERLSQAAAEIRHNMQAPA